MKKPGVANTGQTALLILFLVFPRVESDKHELGKEKRQKSKKVQRKIAKHQGLSTKPPITCQ
ncbi:MAG: hypothetical protein F6K09_28055 [Merismopedia sp. SIO2A8]|nr:hypothetical protein [Merismopedia sp. SIO2A8]